MIVMHGKQYCLKCKRAIDYDERRIFVSTKTGQIFVCCEQCYIPSEY